MDHGQAQLLALEPTLSEWHRPDHVRPKSVSSRPVTTTSPFPSTSGPRSTFHSAADGQQCFPSLWGCHLEHELPAANGFCRARLDAEHDFQWRHPGSGERGILGSLQSENVLLTTYTRLPVGRPNRTMSINRAMPDIRLRLLTLRWTAVTVWPFGSSGVQHAGAMPEPSVFFILGVGLLGAFALGRRVCVCSDSVMS